jgi:hypothetical protein
LSSKFFIGIISAIILLLFVDDSINKITDLVRPQTTSYSMFSVFIIITTFSLFSQYFIIKYIHNNISISSNIPSEVVLIQKFIQIYFYVIMSFFIYLIFQILVFSKYNSFLLLIMMLVSSGLSIFTFGILCKVFITWYKTMRNRIIFYYIITIIIFTIDLLMSVISLLSGWSNVPTHIGDHVATPTRIFTNDFNVSIELLHTITSIISFVVTWITTSIVLKYYSKKIGKLKYWILVSIPLFYFIIQYPTFILNSFEPLIISNPVLYGLILTLFFSMSKITGGIFFGISFLNMWYHSPSQIRSYMLFVGCGLILYFASNQAYHSLTLVPYPPFGLSTVTFVGLSSYMIFIGIYFSALSISKDIRLRLSIKELAIEKYRLLEDIGEAQRESEIMKQVATIIKSLPEKDKSENLSTMTEDDMRNYVSEVITELKDLKIK